MSDLNTMMREQAISGLQVQLDAAVTAGDTAAARKAADSLAQLAVSTAPKAPPFVDADVLVHLNKQPWFGTDPKRSAKVAEFGKTMDPKKFATAEAFAAAIVKAVDEEFKPAVSDPEPDPEEDELDPEDDADKAKAAAKKKRTDGPGEGDVGRAGGRRASGPWTKLSDAPDDVRKEVTRTADKFAPKTKEGREGYIARALQAHYASHQRRKGKS